MTQRTHPIVDPVLGVLTINGSKGSTMKKYIAALIVAVAMTGCATVPKVNIQDQAQTIRTIAALSGKGAEVDQLLKLAGIGSTGPIDPFASAPTIYGPYLDGNGAEIVLPITRKSWKAPITETVVPGGVVKPTEPPADVPPQSDEPSAGGDTLDEIGNIPVP